MHQRRVKARFGELLIRDGAVTEEQISEGLKAQTQSRERLSQCLHRLGYLTEESYLASLAEQLDLERVSLRKTDQKADVQNTLPAEFVRERSVFPFDRRDGVLRIATTDPGDRQLIEDARLLSSLEIDEVLASERENRRVLRHYRRQLDRGPPRGRPGSDRLR